MSHVRTTLRLFIDQIDAVVFERGLTLPEGCDLVLFLRERAGSTNHDWCYYFADHASCSVFWLGSFEFGPHIEEGDKTRPLKHSYDISEFSPFVMRHESIPGSYHLTEYTLEAHYW